ncbi:hypothetical protein D9M69_676880 [compost metagenome]
MVIACSTSFRVSLLMVEYCSPARIDLTDSTSESCPVTTGSGLPAALTALRIARARLSFGDRTPSTLAEE